MSKRTSLRQRFRAKVLVTESCWLWQGASDRNGYGSILADDRRIRLAHRVSYELHIGPIPEGLHIDHLCRVPACVRPDHLEPVTQAENNRRAALAQTTCKYGHPLDGVRTDTGYRFCKTCKRTAQRRGSGQRRVAVHGTHSGYVKHSRVRSGEWSMPSCDACRAANAEHQRGLLRRRREEAAAVALCIAWGHIG